MGLCVRAKKRLASEAKALKIEHSVWTERIEQREVNREVSTQVAIV